MNRLDSALSTTHTSQQDTHHTNTHTHDRHHGETLQEPKQGQMGVGLQTDGVPDQGGRDQIMSNSRHGGKGGANLQRRDDGVHGKTTGKQAGATTFPH